MIMSPLVLAALAVAKNYPVFPTTSKKMPCWSNKELGVKKGEGGFKIATQDPERVKELFSHRNAETVSVPTGATMSGLLCIDVDIYKGGHVVDWHEANREWLEKTLCHETQSGGLHYIFRCTDKTRRFPATLAAGVDVKGHGGYVVFPPSGGYTVLHKRTVKDFPAGVVAKGSTGNVIQMDSYNQYTDAQLIEQIEQATELYPALRSLAYRMPSRRQPDGSYLTETEAINILENICDTSVGASEAHPRHDDWLDRRGKIPDLVGTSFKKAFAGLGVGLTDMEIEALSEGDSFIDTIAIGPRFIGPQRETTPKDIEVRVAAIGDTPTSENEPLSDFVKLNVEDLRRTTLPPIKWVIPQMLGEGGTCSIAGMSNVGKTRYMAALVVAMAVGKTERLGLPACGRKVSTLYIANEEHMSDMARRLKSCALQHGDKQSANIIVRGKASGTFRLVALNETGHPEVDEKNIAILVDEIRKSKCEVLVLDPYVTLSEGGDENSANTASMVTKAFLLIIAMTGVAVIYPHHTPKDRGSDPDAFRGSADAWRGSGAIYSSLDMGFTLCNWYPRGKENRKAWKAQYLSANLSRFIVLDTGKIREGQAIPEQIMELVPQGMDEGEGEPIGVVKMSSEATAMNALLASSVDHMAASELGIAMVNTMGAGQHDNMTECKRLMSGHQLWPDTAKTEGKEKLLTMYGEKYFVENGSVEVRRSGKGKWRIIIEENE
jgi:hypothetical protein